MAFLTARFLRRFFRARSLRRSLNSKFLPRFLPWFFRQVGDGTSPPLNELSFVDSLVYQLVTCELLICLRYRSDAFPRRCSNFAAAGAVAVGTEFALLRCNIAGRYCWHCYTVSIVEFPNKSMSSETSIDTRTVGAGTPFSNIFSIAFALLPFFVSLFIMLTRHKTYGDTKRVKTSEDLKNEVQVPLVVSRTRTIPGVTC